MTREQKIYERLKEIQDIHQPLYEEETLLRNELRSINQDKLESFLMGKNFVVKLSNDYRGLSLYNNKFQPRDLFNNGVEDYHQSFWLTNITICCNDGDVTISGSSWKELLNYAKKMSFVLDFSEIEDYKDNLEELISVLDRYY